MYSYAQFIVSFSLLFPQNIKKVYNICYSNLIVNAHKQLVMADSLFVRIPQAFLTDFSD